MRESEELSFCWIWKTARAESRIEFGHRIWLKLRLRPVLLAEKFNWSFGQPGTQGELLKMQSRLFKDFHGCKKGKRRPATCRWVKSNFGCPFSRLVFSKDFSAGYSPPKYPRAWVETLQTWRMRPWTCCGFFAWLWTQQLWLVPSDSPATFVCFFQSFGTIVLGSL